MDDLTPSIRSRRGAVLTRLAPTRGWTPPVPGRRRSARSTRAALPEVLEEVARSLRSGSSVLQALAEAAQGGDDSTRHQLRAVVARVQSGEDLSRALDRWREDASDPAVALPVAALALAGDGGGSPAWAVDQVAATLRERLARHDELRAQSSQATLSASVLVVSPVVFAAVTAAVDPRMVAFLLGTPAGWACIATGLAFDAGGAWWMRRILRSIP